MRHAGIADGHQQPAEIGIGGKEGGFHQWRVGNGACHPQRFVFAGRGFDLHRDELGGAFAVARDGLRQGCRHFDQGCFQHCPGRITFAVDHRRTRLTGGQQYEGIIGRGIAIDRDAIKGMIRHPSHHALQCRLRQGSVGGEIGQHGGHVRLQHAHTLGDAADADGTSVQLAAGRTRLGHGVGGHDGGCGIGPVLSAATGCSQRFGQRLLDTIDR